MLLAKIEIPKLSGSACDQLSRVGICVPGWNTPDSSYEWDSVFIAVRNPFHPIGHTDMPDHDQYGEWYFSVLTFEPLAQTWHVKMWWWKPNSIKCENNFKVTSRRTRAGLNLEPGTAQFRYQRKSKFFAIAVTNT